MNLGTWDLRLGNGYDRATRMYRDPAACNAACRPTPQSSALSFVSSPVRPVAAVNESWRATGESDPPLVYPPLYSPAPPVAAGEVASAPREGARAE